MVTLHTDNLESQTSSTVDLFSKSWRVYREIIEHNYLSHQEIEDTFAAELLKRGDQSVDVLDLGCGDCWLPAHLFSRPGAPSLRSFRGVDASHAALALAAAPGLFPAGSHVELVEMDMRMFLESCETASCHIVLSSFAIHHLLTPDKARLLRQVHRVLAPGGTLLYADVYNSVPGSTRDEAVLGRWRATFTDGYQALSPEERAEVWAHVSAHDLPEDLPTTEAMLRGAGFREQRCAFADGFYAAVWVATK